MLCEEFRELKRLAKIDGKDYDYDLNGRVDNLNKAFDFTSMEIDIILKDKSPIYITCLLSMRNFSRKKKV